MNVTILGNFDVWDTTEDPEFQHTGTWYDYFTGDTLEVTDVNEAFFLTPGEYRLFTDVKLPEPEMGFIQVTGLLETPVADFEMTLSPNPAAAYTNLAFTLPANQEVRLSVFNRLGQLVEVVLDEKRSAGSHQVQLGANLAKGQYWVLLETEGQTKAEMLVIQR